ncbi:AAA family ATPase [Nocardia blacklockiae]|uniref:AAA family ATPase n=1 Tax=Nocardia blacklockiae TaxID=480036 RepID=UPI001893FBE4|nr:LuxR C-terminal-related transcriptional regulator [Nocardia blacklockiae]MBF6170590.1 AAA family ATPase [Nocardia blacklockiae]
MPESSISTSTTFPQFAFPVVPRPELYGRLDAATAGRGGGPVLLVTAAAGTGKTVLVAQWAGRHLRGAHPGLRVGWVRASAAPGLHRAVPAALGLADPGRQNGETASAATLLEDDETASAATLSGDGDPRDRAARLLAAVHDHARPTVLVIDDAHALTAPADLAYLQRLVTGAPPNLTTVLSARHEPALRWHAVDLDRRVSRVHAGDLAFSEDRAAQLCRQRHRALTGGELAMLMGLTRGWPALITLAAGHLAARDDGATALTELAEAPAPIAHFLSDEVLAPLPDRLRRFARITSVPGAFTAALAERLTGEDAVPVLHELTRLGFPMTRHARDGDLWHTYHPLLRTHLLAEARRDHEVDTLHLRTADWYRTAGLPRSALHHLLRTPHAPELPEFLRGNGIRLVLDGQGPDLFRQLDRAGVAAGEPLLHALRAVDALERHDVAEAITRLDLLHRRPDGTGTLAPDTWIALLTSAVSAGIALATGVGLAEFRIPARVPATGQPEIDGYAALRFGTVALAHDDLATADRQLRRALALADCADNPRLAVRTRVRLAAVAGVRGATGRMRGHADHALAVAARHGLGEYTETQRAQLLSAFGGYLRGEQAPRPGSTGTPGRHLEVVAALLDFDVAADRYTAAETLRRATVVLLRRPLPQPTVAARLLPHVVCALLRVDAAHSARLLIEQAGTVLGDTPDLTLARAALTLAQRPATTHALVEPLLATAGPAPNAITAWVLDAAAHAALGNAPQARTAITAAVRHAAPQRLLRPFLDVPGTAQLLDAHSETFGHDNDFAARIRRHPALTRSHHPPRLTASERTVLDQLPSGRTAQQIAEVLGVSINTVKTHLRGIHAKFGTSNRADALDSARRTGLL